MKRSCRRFLSFALVLTLAFGMLSGGSTALAKTFSHGDIVILYTNDAHNGVNQVKDQDGTVTNIGYAGVAAYKDKMEKQYGENYVTLVDAGDSVQGDAIGTLSQGQ